MYRRRVKIFFAQYKLTSFYYTYLFNRLYYFTNNNKKILTHKKILIKLCKKAYRIEIYLLLPYIFVYQDEKMKNMLRFLNSNSPFFSFQQTNYSTSTSKKNKE
jgi:hypothetical protein